MSVEGEQRDSARTIHDRLMGYPARSIVVKEQPIEVEEQKPFKLAPNLWPHSDAIVFPASMSRTIIRQCAEKHGLTLGEICSHRRESRIVKGRQEAMWRLSKETPLSLPEIARRLGGFDHTTALHAIRKHQSRIDAGEFL